MYRTLYLVMMVAAACESALINPIGDLDECPPPQGELAPTDCALIRGSVRSPAGIPRRGFPVRVDSILQGAYYYASDAGLTDEESRDDHESSLGWQRMFRTSRTYAAGLRPAASRRRLA